MSLQLTAGRYLLLLLTSVLGTFALLWVYTARYRADFLPESYGPWRAVIQMADTCDTGDIAVLGASQASVDVMPGLLDLPVSARNFGLTASTPIEAYFLAKRLTGCPKPPKVAVLVYAGYDFAETGYFWDRAARYGLLGFAELQDVARTAAEVADPDLYHGAFGAEPPPAMKNLLYAAHFPPYDFKSLLAAKGSNRRSDNDRLTAETLLQHGQHLISDEPGTDVHGWEADQESFQPSPLSMAYFGRLLGLLRVNGVKIVFMAPPMSDLTRRDLHGRYAEDYARVMARVWDKHPEVAVLGPTFPTMDHSLFSDPVHLNGRGAAAFSRTMGSLLSPALSHDLLVKDASRLSEPQP